MRKMKEALFYKKKNTKVQCFLCPRNCVITNNATGFCRVRKNIEGKLYSLSYGRVISAAIDPIEKKPFYHFAPASIAFSIAGAGCNLSCDFCCNFEISQEWSYLGEQITAEEIVSKAKRLAHGISYTYTEPSIWIEFILDIAKLAKKEKLYNTMVTNGYTSVEAVKELSKYMDAVVIDLKNSGNKEAYLKLSHAPYSEKIFDAILEYAKNKVWVEITNLIVTQYGECEKDVRNFCKWTYENLGEFTPVHFLRYFPSYKLNLPPTPIKFLEKCITIAKEEGLKYVYLGNVLGSYENTYCHECGKLLIERKGFYVTKINLKNSLCPYCGAKIPIEFL